MAELVYALVLGTSGAILGGSSPLLGTRQSLVQKRSDVITSFLRRGLESRSATARGGVAGFFSRKKPVTKSFHCFFACVEAFGSESFRLDETWTAESCFSSKKNRRAGGQTKNFRRKIFESRPRSVIAVLSCAQKREPKKTGLLQSFSLLWGGAMFSDHRKQRAGVAKIPSDGEELFVTRTKN